MFRLIKLLVLVTVGYLAYEFMVGLTACDRDDDDGGEPRRGGGTGPRSPGRRRSAPRVTARAS